MGHFSGWAGGVALSVLVIPVVVRTTEDKAGQPITIVMGTGAKPADALEAMRASARPTLRNGVPHDSRRCAVTSSTGAALASRSASAGSP